MTGIIAHLDYLKGVESRALYIISLYESNDNDHMAVMNHTTIDSVYGTMDDFDQLIQGTKNNNSMKYLKHYILSVQMDNFLHGWVFIAEGRYHNHTHPSEA